MSIPKIVIKGEEDNEDYFVVAKEQLINMFFNRNNEAIYLENSSFINYYLVIRDQGNKEKAFYLGYNGIPDVEWKIVRDDMNVLCLVPIVKREI